jgi:hypothetical protein
MSTARKFKPNWDDAAYIMRTDPEREKKPRVQAEIIKLPATSRLNAAKAVAAWEAIGLDNITEEHIRAHWRRLRKWQGK